MQVRTTGTTHRNPTPEELRAFTERMPQARITEFDNVNVQTRVVSRSSGSTYVVTEDPPPRRRRPSAGRNTTGWPGSRTSTSPTKTSS